MKHLIESDNMGSAFEVDALANGNSFGRVQR